MAKPSRDMLTTGLVGSYLLASAWGIMLLGAVVILVSGVSSLDASLGMAFGGFAVVAGILWLGGAICEAIGWIGLGRLYPGLPPWIGWLEGSLRLMPPWEISLGDYLIPNPFFPGVLLPGVTFLLLYAWPWLEARFTHDHDVHHILDRPRDRPVRTALGVATLTFYVILFAAGATDVLAVTFGLSVNRIVWTFRTLLVVAPPVAALVAHRVCKELQRRDGPPEPLPGEAPADEDEPDPVAEPVGA